MPDDLDLAVYAAATYHNPAFGLAPVDWDAQGTTSGVVWYLKYVPEGTIVAFEGTHDWPDWERDFSALPVEIDGLGLVHPGFYIGLPDAWSAIKLKIKGDLFICGHSLGAAHATILAALAVRDGVPPARRLVLGEPRPGGDGLAAILKDVPSASYCTRAGVRHDFVTDVPLALPGFSYRHPTLVTELPAKITQAAEAAYGPIFLCHYPPVYLAALAAAAPPAA